MAQVRVLVWGIKRLFEVMVTVIIDGYCYNWGWDVRDNRRERSER